MGQISVIGNVLSDTLEGPVVLVDGIGEMRHICRQEVLAGVAGVYFVSDTFACLRTGVL